MDGIKGRERKREFGGQFWRERKKEKGGGQQ